MNNEVQPRKRKRLAVCARILCAALPFLFAKVVTAQPYTESENRSPSIHSSRAITESHEIHYAYSGSPKKHGLLFLHGTPGGWAAFEVYLQNKELQQDFFMVSVDRLGWGDSTLPSRLIDGKFDLQAKSIAAVMAKYPDKKWTVIGHSLGASIAPKVALIAPDAVDSLLLLAGSLDPKLGKPRWYNQAASTWVVSRLIGKTMRYSNREIMGLHKELSVLERELASTNLNANLTVMQGMKDRLVSPRNPAYVRKKWLDTFNDVVFIELAEEGHFLPWRQTALVIETIYQLTQATSINTK